MVQVVRTVRCKKDEMFSGVRGDRCFDGRGATVVT